jgi:hypothetical protein
MFVRFSTVAGERGAADAERDIRGTALKFYTEEGNWDIVGNNTPVFFFRDPLRFPDLNHAIKRDPRTGMRSADNNWDFWTLLPEAVHQVTVVMSDRGIPKIADPHHVGGHLGIKMGGNRSACRCGDSGRSLPACHAADPHEVRHDVIASFHLQGGVERARSVEILADLDRGLQIRGQSGIAFEVVIDGGLLDPGEAEIVDRVTSFQRLTEVKSLVEIDHQAHLRPYWLGAGLAETWNSLGLNGPSRPCPTSDNDAPARMQRFKQREPPTG